MSVVGVGASRKLDEMLERRRNGEDVDEPDYLAAERRLAAAELAGRAEPTGIARGGEVHGDPGLTGFLDPDLDEFLATDDPPYDFVLQDIAESGDRIIVTGVEGGGKSTLLRSIAVQAAAGLHPFTLEDIEPVRTLLIDCENSVRHVRRKLQPLRDLVGDRYQPGMLRLNIVGQALDLARDDVYNAISLRVKAHAPRLIIVGPLYKMTDGDPRNEEPARALADHLDRLRAISGAALVIEAHTPYAEGSKSRRPIRPYGASLWSRWPEFGIYLDPDGTIEHWRGPRDERSWPTRLTRSAPWPWMVAANTGTAAWDGTTECMAAIKAYLADHPDDEFSKSALPAKLRATGRNYRDRTIADALEHLATEGRIDHRRGPRNADLYRHSQPEKPLEF